MIIACGFVIIALTKPEQLKIKSSEDGKGKNAMRRIWICFIVLCMLCCSCALGEGIDFSALSDEQLAELQSGIREELNSRHGEHHQMITLALNVLRNGWQQEYQKKGMPGTTYYLDIRGVRVIKLKDNLDEKASEVFDNSAYIVEFLLYDDYWSASLGLSYSGHNTGYLDLTAQNDSVLVSKFGFMTLSSQTIKRYMSRTYAGDFSEFVESVTDYHDQYNQIIEITVK